MPRGAIILVALGGLVVTVAGIKAVATIVGPVFLALILTIAVHPLPARLHRRGVPTAIAVTLTIVLVYGILGVLFVSIVFSLARLATILPEHMARFDDLTGSINDALTSHGVDTSQAHAVLRSIDSHTLLNALTRLLESTVSITSALIFVLVLLLFMAADAVSFPARIAMVARMRPEIADALVTFARDTRSYLLVTTVFGLIVAVLDAGALWALGVPLPLLWGLVSFVTNYIPNIGFVIGVAPPALLAFLDGGWQSMLVVIVVYSVINVVIQSFIQPKFVGDAIDLSLTLTFLSLAFWSWVIGPLGAILAIPLTLFAKALLVDVDPSTRWADSLVQMKVAAPDKQDHAQPGDKEETSEESPAG